MRVGLSGPSRVVVAVVLGGVMQEGFNFGNDGWARVDIDGNGGIDGVRGSSYAVFQVTGLTPVQP